MENGEAESSAASRRRTYIYIFDEMKMMFCNGTPRVYLVWFSIYGKLERENTYSLPLFELNFACNYWWGDWLCDDVDNENGQMEFGTVFSLG